MIKKMICLIKGHNSVKENKKDMFGYYYVWQKGFCQRCGKRTN